VAKNLDPQAEMEAALPDPAERRAVLRQLVASIECANSVAPEAWVLSLNPKPGRIFCLTVGITEVLVLHSGGLRLLLEGPLGDDLIEQFTIGRPARNYTTGGPNQYDVTLPPSQIEAAQAVLGMAHHKFIEQVGRRRSDNAPRSGAPNRTAHSSDLVEYAKQFVAEPDARYFVLQWDGTNSRTGAEYLEAMQREDGCVGRWTCGKSTKLRIDDIVLLRRTNSPPLGLVGYGRVTRGSSSIEEWDPLEQQVEVKWQRFSKIPYLLKSDSQISEIDGLWVQANGAMLPNAEDGQIIVAALHSATREPVPDENDNDARSFPEGREYEVRLTVHERNPAARRECLLHYKSAYACEICKMNFSDVFGADIGAAFIHVHHINPLANRGRLTNPKTELIPVCPNCHAMLHKEDPPICPESLKKRLRERGHKF
jgi:5-methylcytosine-specific restriction enzyme A